MEFNFDTMQTIVVNKNEFNVDVSSVENINKLIQFREKYKLIRELDKEWVDDCKIVINKILGEGSYDKIFEKDSIHAYFLVIKLCEIYFNEADKYIEDNTKNEIEQLRDLASVLGDVAKYNNMLSRGRNKYDIPKKKPTKKHKN